MRAAASALSRASSAGVARAQQLPVPCLRTLPPQLLLRLAPARGGQRGGLRRELRARHAPLLRERRALRRLPRLDRAILSDEPAHLGPEGPLPRGRRATLRRARGRRVRARRARGRRVESLREGRGVSD